MTRAQLAYAAGADEKWVENTARLLCHRLAFTPDEARWLGLVRLLRRELGIPVSRSATLAREALRHPPSSRAVVLAATSDGSASVVVDLARYYSSFAVRLSTALINGSPSRRGRPAARRRSGPRGALAAAAEYGVDLSLLREGLRLTPAERLERLDADAAFLAAIRPRR